MAIKNYEWLSDLQLPKIVAEGLSFYGTTEIPGAKSNQVILDWAKEVGLERDYKNDDTAWCGLFVAAIVKRTGREPIKDPLWARNWAKWGVKSPKPGLGDILVFSRGSFGHVGFYIAEDATSFYVLGGNQSNTVNITRIAKDRMISCRRPEYINQPLSVKEYVIASNGKLSTNEA